MNLPVAADECEALLSDSRPLQVASSPSPSLSQTSAASFDVSSDDDYDPGPLSSPSRSSSALPLDPHPSAGCDSPARSSSPVSPLSSPVDLPSFQPMGDPQFQWKSLAGRKCMKLIDKCYEVAVHWIPNLFKVPHGKHGRSFVAELSTLFRDYADDSSKECVALKAAFLLPLLVLQKPHRRSKTSEHVSALERRLSLWHDGCFDDLLKEGETIQRKFAVGPRAVSKDLAGSFSKLMFQGKVKAALRLLNGSGSRSGQPLSLNSPISSGGSTVTVRDKLIEKHPDPAPLHPSHSLLQTTPPPDHEPHFIEFHQIDGGLIRSMILRMDGAAGPSGMDVSHWKKVCTSFARESDNLCDSIAMVARKICSNYVDPLGISALVASRLIALDKNPGVRPIGIGEVVRRVIGKAILSVIKPDILDVTGCSQLCAGVSSACEGIVHTVKEVFDSGDAEGLLLVDASNAFNSLNRKLALRNILHQCPSLGRILINLYRVESSLFIGKDTLLSREGTTQGDPLAMVMYGVASIPLINELNRISEVRQLWYADDATGVGTMDGLKKWWDKINSVGESYGYLPNAVKSTLLVRPELFDKACKLFNGTNVSVTSEGVVVLGSPVGSPSYVQSVISKRVEVWCKKLKVLADIAVSQPQSAYSAFTHGLFGEWTYLFRTCSFDESLIQPLEDCMRQVFIPALLGRDAVSDLERDWLSLPTRSGGLGLHNPLSLWATQRAASLSIVRPLVNLLLSKRTDLPLDVDDRMLQLKKECAKTKEMKNKSLMNHVKSQLTPERVRLFEVSTEKGSSNWLTALPIKEFGFDLSKGEFRDAISLRYGWRPSDLPLSCVCGESFTVAHSLMCVYGGLITHRHNDIRDLSVSLLKEVCPNVCREPTLQPITGESLQLRTASSDDGARLDVSAEGFWGHRYQRVFFDVRVFCPLSSTNTSRSLSACYKDNEEKKKRKYDQRVREVEHSTFSPLVFSSSGGCGPIATQFIKRLAQLHAEKSQHQYSTTINFIRCRYSFSIIRSAIRCLRGCRSRYKHMSIDSSDFIRAASEAQISAAH